MELWDFKWHTTGQAKAAEARRMSKGDWKA